MTAPLTFGILCGRDELGRVARLIFCLADETQEPGDEIIVVFDGEAGSTRTALLLDTLQRENVKLSVEYRNLNSFADQRNHVLDVASNEYVLFVDTDEVLRAASVPLARDLAEGRMVDLCWLPRLNFLPRRSPDIASELGWTRSDGLVNFPDFQPRIVRCAHHIRWLGTVHETVGGAVVQTFALPFGEAGIVHSKSVRNQVEQLVRYRRATEHKA